MIVYIAGPYTSGDVAENVKNAMDAASQLIDAGISPYVPHLSHFLHMNEPKEYEVWMRIGLEFLEICDVVLLLPGKSPGAERETTRAAELKIPVFTNISDLINAYNFSEENF